MAQWSAQCARACARFSAVFGNGFFIRFALTVTAMLRALLATKISIRDGLSRALKPWRIIVTPKAAMTRTTMTADHSTSAFTSSPFVISPRLRHAATRRQIGFTNGSVDLCRWSRRFKTISQQESFQSDGAHPEIFQRGDVVRLQLEQSSLRDQHLRVGSRHVAVAI